MANIYDAKFRENMTYVVEVVSTSYGQDMRHAAVLHSRTGISFREAREFQRLRETQGYNAIIRAWCEA